MDPSRIGGRRLITRVFKGKRYTYRGETVSVVLNLSMHRNSMNVVYRVEKTGELVKVPRNEFMTNAEGLEGKARGRHTVLTR